MIYELIESYKLNLCNEVKKYKVLAYGFTATIFVNKGKPEFVIKEIYLKEDSLISSKLRELSINIFIDNDEELRKLAPKFIGFDICDKRMLLKFKYCGPSLKETIGKLNFEKLFYIKENVEQSLDKFNKKGIINDDLHLGNIFYYRNKVYIGDWGKVIDSKIKKDDLKIFYREFLIGIYMSYFFKQNTMNSIKKYMNSKGLFQKVIDLTVKEVNYQKKHLSYKPKDFVDKNYPLFLQINLEKILFYEAFPYVKEHTKLPEDLYDFVDYLASLL